MKAKILALVLLSATSSLVLAPPIQALQATVPSQTVADIAPPEHPATPDQIREYLALVNYVSKSHKAMDELLKVSRATAAPYYPAAFWEDMGTAIKDIDIITPVVPAYQKYFSEEDMAATIAFYKSPAGKRLLEADPFIASLSGDTLRKIGREAGEKVGLKHKAEIEELMKKGTQSSPAKSADSSQPGK